MNLSQTNPSAVPGFLAGGGEMGQRIREYDWSKTPLGPVSTWPQSLQTCIRIMLTSSQPIWIGWGGQLIKFYNDAYRAIVGGKHPWALGSPVSVVWKDIWRDIEPMLKQVMEKDEGIYMESQLLIMERNGYPEETYYTFSYTPVPGDDGGTAGIICANTDDTYRIISERQLKTVTQLGNALTDVKTDADVINKTIQSLRHNQYDFPFAAFYSCDGTSAVLQQTTGTEEHPARIPSTINLQGSNEISMAFAGALVKKKLQVIEGIDEKFGDMPKGAWAIPASKAVVLPILQAANKDPYGFLLFGCNPYRLLDENYSNFFSLINDQVVTSFSNAHAFEEERKRLEALAEIDRAKTTFFSNISHEFRTPLTLLLGPIIDVLNDTTTNNANRQRMELAYRNALRMQKLVNTLLEFSRIEAGRAEGRYSRVNIAALTQDFASTFRSAIEKAGMQLIFFHEPVTEEVYVDIDMWEKIVLNLVSNAFKYSKQGEITVGIKQVNGNINLIVSDTGIGIPEDQLDKVFNRFHRVDNSEGRSQEGTGIGLAMVKELVRLHGGTIEVTSKRGSGSTFTVCLPAGKGHLPADKIVAFAEVSGKADSSAAFIEEAMKWLPGEIEPAYYAGEDNGNGVKQDSDGERKQKILLADDNADMREYVYRLLKKEFTVILATNGEEAYAKALEYKPTLVISDVMMPKLDGFGLLKKIRAHADIKNVPVIFLSARAGEEATLEGLDAGADDYMVKPFSAKELIVRVNNLIRINQVRRETELQFYQLFVQSPAFINVFKGPDHVYEFFHPKNKEIFGNKDFTGMSLRTALPELEGQGIVEILDDVYLNNKTVQYNERYVVFKNEAGEKSGRYFNAFYQPWYDLKGQVQGVLNFATDVTETIEARKKVEQSESRFRNLVLQAPASIMVLAGRDLIVDVVNDNFLQMIDRKREAVLNKPIWESVPEAKSQGFDDLLQQVINSGTTVTGYETQAVIKRNGKTETIYVNYIYSPLKDIDENVTAVMVVAIEVTPQVIARKKIEESEKSLIEMANAIPQLTWMANSNGDIIYVNNRVNDFAGITGDGKGNWLLAGGLHPADRDLTERAWASAVERGSIFQKEVRMQMANQAYRWHLSRAIPQKDEAGKVVKWFGTSTDIHDAKEHAAILENEVKNRTGELRTLNISLEKSNEDLQQFAHVASHDLKEPVRKIKTYIGRLEDEYGTLLPEKGTLFLNKIQQATQRMYSMIEGVLNYSTLNSAGKTIEVVNLDDVIKSIEADLEIAIQQKNAVIHKTTLPQIEGASVLLYQLFYNLLNNSLKFSRRGVQPLINISGSVEIQDKKQYASIIFADNGIGFEPEYSQKIFDTFSRLNAKDAYEGTGLGLALCKKITERHHGTISANGKKNEGAVFTIMLPLIQPEKNI